MIRRVVITGGPCGGKTTALPFLSDHFKKKGLKVYTVPEIATLFHMHGVDLLYKIKTNVFDLEHSVFRAQLALEDAMHRIAISDEESLILCDRGLGDFQAYIPPDLWETLLKDFEMSQEDLHGRYHMIVHLTTAAIGAEQHFTNENNPARNCTPELAYELDRKTLKAWSGHRFLTEIDNSTDFKGKIDRTIKAIENTICI
jgi:predicted ATPase